VEAPLASVPPARAMRMLEFEGGLVEVGHDPDRAGFAFDNESPRHRVYSSPSAWPIGS